MTESSLSCGLEAPEELHACVQVVLLIGRVAQPQVYQCLADLLHMTQDQRRQFLRRESLVG